MVLTKLSQMRARADLLDERLGGRIVPFKPTRIVKHQIDPRRLSITTRADESAIVPGRREAHFNQRIRQMLLLVHRFVKSDKLLASLERLYIRNRKLELLMKVIDGAIESFVTLHHDVSASLQAVTARRQQRQQSRVSHEVSKPGRQQCVERDRNELAQWTKKRLRFRSAVPGADLALPGKRKQIETEMFVLCE